MSKRKPHNRGRRHLMGVRAVLRSNCIAVVNVGERQGLIHWKNLKSIAGSRRIVDGICDLPHHWTIYLAVLCRDQMGERYIKSSEIAPQGVYKAAQIGDAIEHYHNEITSTCNPAHIVARAWIALPYPVSLSEEQADRVFDAVRAWDQEKAA